MSDSAGNAKKKGTVTPSKRPSLRPARRGNAVTVEAQDGAEAYAYPHPRGIAWGVNAPQTGVNVLRGIRRPDGADDAEG
jgi:hypothetical protein